jgi:hypothetical protein
MIKPAVNECMLDHQGSLTYPNSLPTGPNELPHEVVGRRPRPPEEIAIQIENNIITEADGGADCNASASRIL